jgi:prepilin-type N-terminal cleavage/methylation domain-containing protein
MGFLKMLSVLVCFFVMQAKESREDIDRILGFLERQPKTVHATGMYFDRDKTESTRNCNFEYKRNGDELCFIFEYSSSDKNAYMVKNGILHSAIGIKDGADRVDLYSQGKLPNHKYESYKMAFPGGVSICSVLLQIDSGFFAKVDLADLIKQVVSENRRSIEISKPMGGISLAIGPDANGEQLIVSFNQSGHMIEFINISPVVTRRSSFLWEDNRLRSVRREMRNRSTEPWGLRKEVVFDTWESDLNPKDVAFTMEEYGIAHQRFYMPIAFLIPLVGFFVLLLIYAITRGVRSLSGSQGFRLTKRNGMTMVEVMVALAILGILAAVGLPAIQAAREASRLASCKSNSLQIGTALNAHESVRKTYPSGGWGFYWYTLSDRSGAAQPGGWIYPILPYMEQQTFYSRTPNTNDLRIGRFELFREQAKIPIPAFRCPSKVTKDVLLSEARMVFGVVGPCVRPDYALSGGTSAHAAGFPGPETLQEAESPSFQWPDEIERGIARRRFSRKSQDVTDGLSNTILLGEKCSDKWRARGNNSLNADDQPYLTGFGFDNIRFTGRIYNDLGEFVGEKLGTDAVNWEGGGPFGGSHPGITVFVRCDGSVQAISNDIELDTIARLGHISDGQAINVE